MLHEALKVQRKKKGWSLRELSRRSGISVSALSKVERGELSLTYDKLQQLADGLGIEVAALFSKAGGNGPLQPNTRRSYSPADSGETIATANYLHRYTHTDLSRKAFTPIHAEVNARTLTEFGDLVKHQGEEYCYVLEGEVTLHTEHYAPLIVKAGESVYFDSTMGHAYINSGDGTARILCIASDAMSGDSAP